MSQPELRQENSAPRTFYTIHFTGEGFRTLAVYKHFYRAALQRIKAAHEAYDREVAEWYETGDGASPDWRTEVDEETGEVYRYNAGGQGHTFPHCIHGASRWTDYDNICGGCEDGYGPVALAISEARTDWLRFVGVFEWMSSTPAAIPDEIRKEIAAFSATLFPKPSKGV